MRSCIIGYEMASGLESVVGLAFETSSAVGAVAIGRGAEVLGIRRLTAPRSHAVELLPAVASLFRDLGLEPKAVQGIYVSVGPGSFTGLRIGVTAARMLALATGATLTAVPTLEVIAQNALDAPQPPDRVAVLLDAKRARVYAATFVRRDDRYVGETEPVEQDPLKFLVTQPALAENGAVLGEGVLYHRSAVRESGLAVLPESLCPPRAETVYRLGFRAASEGRFVEPHELVPTYIRPPEAEEKWAQRHGDPRRTR